MNVDHLPGDLTVPSFGPRMVCIKCGMIGGMSDQIGRNVGRSATRPRVYFSQLLKADRPQLKWRAPGR
jgi:hypothetical protein